MKKIFTFIFAFILILSLCSCGQPTADLGADAEPVAPPEESSAAISNPFTEYHSLSEINSVVGCSLCHPAVMGVTDEKFFALDCGEYSIAEYDFSLNGADYCFRAAKTESDDISGFYIDGAPAFTNEPTEQIEFNFSNDNRLARWLIADMQYVLSASDNEMSRENFEAISGEMKQLCCDVAFDAEIYSSLAGEYTDANSKRAVASVITENKFVNITVHWSGSAFEYAEWKMTARLDGEDRLVYEDCVHSIVSTDENGEEHITVEYSGGSGYFTLTDVSLYWDGAADENCRDCVFEKLK